MDDLINDFIAETREMLQSLSGAVVAWEADPRDRARLDEIFRFVHTVKGNCGFFDLPRLERLSHAAEDALAEVRAGRRSACANLVTAVLAILDRIGELIDALEAGESLDGGDDETLVAALNEEAPVAALAASGSDAEREPRKGLRTVRLSIELLDSMMNAVSDAVLARNELARCIRETSAGPAVGDAFERVSACIAEIRDAITRTRMQRIDGLFAALPRLVRDLSGELGKEVALEVDGGDVELDREMIETIRDPLTHIIRNALDHGIERPEERVAAGKKRAGCLRICARQAGNQILIEIVDDGRGIDGEGLVRKAMNAGLLSAERAASLSPKAQAALIFEPGLSTAGKVTAVSGRGVGMDVVRSNIERIGGLVDLDTKPGQGVRITLRVPLTLSIIPALTVTAGGQAFAIPRSSIEEILRRNSSAVKVESVGEAQVVAIRGRRMALVPFGALLGRGGAATGSSDMIILLKPAGGDTYALAVDAVHDHEELVVKPAAPAVMAAGLYAGTTLAEDGSPILLLDPSGIAAKAGLRFGEAGEVTQEIGEADEMAAQEQVSLLLFRSLDGAKRAVRLSAVERIEEVAAEDVRFTAGRLRAAIRERLVPLAGCAAAPAEGKMRALLFSDGAAELAYGFADIIDIVSASAELQPAASPGEIAGAVLIGGEQVELIDPYGLFAAHGARAPARVEEAARPVCAIPADDPWMENMLRPLLETLGYRVVAAGAGEAADIFVASAETDAPAAPDGAKVLRIRSQPETLGDNDNSIYRYDQAALMSALGRSAAEGNLDG